MSDSDAHDESASPPPLASEFACDPEIEELVRCFIGELHTRVGALQECWEHGNHQLLRQVASHLQGAAGGYGFPDITAAAAELEQSLTGEEAAVSTLQEKVEALILLCRRAAETEQPGR